MEPSIILIALSSALLGACAVAATRFDWRAQRPPVERAPSHDAVLVLERAATAIRQTEEAQERLEEVEAQFAAFQDDYQDAEGEIAHLKRQLRLRGPALEVIEYLDSCELAMPIEELAKAFPDMSQDERNRQLVAGIYGLGIVEKATENGQTFYQIIPADRPPMLAAPPTEPRWSPEALRWDNEHPIYFANPAPTRTRLSTVVNEAFGRLEHAQ